MRKTQPMNPSTTSRNTFTSPLVGTASLLLLLSTGTAVGAQTDTAAQTAQTEAAAASPGEAAPDRWFISLGGGQVSTGDGPSGTVSFDHSLFGSEQGEFDADYAGGDASHWELTFGFHLRGPLALGLTWSESSLSDHADVVGRLPHPFLFDSPRIVEGTSRGLSRDDTALHLSLRWLVRDGEKVQVALFGGPSQIDVEYDVATAILFDQSYPFDTADFVGLETRKESDSALGYHLGVDVGWWFSRSTGLGGVVRFSDASLDLDAPGGAVAIDGGGLQTAVDLRFRF